MSDEPRPPVDSILRQRFARIFAQITFGGCSSFGSAQVSRHIQCAGGTKLHLRTSLPHPAA